ncbi:MAG TPA: hypothetical protein GXZ74_00255 [Tissierellia bacterium]|nr:hypothetical protein [Tissierellia bacterium]
MRYRQTISLISLLMIFTILSACGSFEQATLKQDEVVFVASDESREFFYLPDTTEHRVEDGDDILSLRVHIVHRGERGFLGQEEQLWHIDYKNERYQVTASYAFDADGNFRQT